MFTYPQVNAHMLLGFHKAQCILLALGSGGLPSRVLLAYIAKKHVCICWIRTILFMLHSSGLALQSGLRRVCKILYK